MAGGLMVKPAGRVTLTPLGLSQLMAELEMVADSTTFATLVTFATLAGQLPRR